MQKNSILVNHGISCSVLALVVALGASGCASTSVFKSYPSQVNPVITSVKQKEPLKSPVFVKETQSKDKTLYLMERGRVQQLYGNTSASKTDFDAAIAAIRENDEKAKVSVSDAAAQAAAVLLNDNAIPYNAAGCERVMLRYLQAMNYLASGDLDGARVESANADAEQKDAAQKHAKEIEKAEKKAAAERDKKQTKDIPPTVSVADAPKSETVPKSKFGSFGGGLASLKQMAGDTKPAVPPPQQDADIGLPDFVKTYEFIKTSLGDQYAGLDEVVGKVKNSFQNGAAYFLSGVIYEALKDNNNAYISYRQALELNPENKTLQKDVARIAMLDGRSEDISELKTRFGFAEEEIKKTVAPEGFGYVVVMYEDNFVAQKQEIKIPIPILGSEAVRKGPKSLDLQGADFIAFPIYNIAPVPVLPLVVKIGDSVGETMPLCSVNALAVKDLKEKALIMATRQVIRFVAKAVAIKIAHDKGGDLGGLAASMAAGATENADLRSWLTLPQDIQVSRLTLPAGENVLSLTAGSCPPCSSKIKVVSGKTTLVRVVGTGVALTVTTSVF